MLAARKAFESHDQLPEEERGRRRFGSRREIEDTTSHLADTIITNLVSR